MSGEIWILEDVKEEAMRNVSTGHQENCVCVRVCVGEVRGAEKMEEREGKGKYV